MADIIKILFLILNKKQQAVFFVALIMIFISLVLETFGIGMILPIINILVTGKKNTNIDLIDNYLVDFTLKEVFFIYLIIFFVFYLFKNTIVLIAQFLQLKIIYQIKENLSKKLFEEFLFKDYRYYIEKNSSVFINKLGQSINDFTTCLRFVFNTLSDIAFITILLIFLFYLKPGVTLAIICSILIPSQVFIFLRKKKLLYDGQDKTYLESNNIKNIQQSLNGIKEIKLLKLENYFLNIFKLNINKICNYEFKHQFISSIPRLILELTALAIFILGFFLYSIKSFNQIINIIPTIAVFTAAAFRVIPSFSRLLEAQQNLNFYRNISLDIYNDFKNKFKLRKFKDNKYTTTVKKIPRFLILKNLSFWYGKNKLILNKLNYKIKLNGIVGIVGDSGSGKSTLVDLIIGFLKPTKGEILINNKDINKDEITLENWRSLLGYIPQSISILDETIEKNIALGKSNNEIDTDKINKILKICDLEKFIKSKKEGTKTVLGEKGSKISGGQKQKIGIARALYFNPKIIILDEATNSLDEKTEELIINNLKKNKNLSCIFMITHKKKLMKKFDKIIKVNINSSK
jgi:ABC-type bacteriocin/lantibiotic exporter with double-glycine peptidase domain